MANSNTPNGLQVIRGGGSYSFNAQGSLYSVPTSDSSNAYYLNDAVKAAAGGSTEGIPNVVKITTAEPLRGSLQAIFVVPPIAPASLVGSTSPTLGVTYIPATKANVYFVLVNDDPTTIYSVQDDGITTGSLVAASSNLNSNLTITNGSTTTSPSGTVLLSSSFTSGATAGNMKLLGLVQQPGNTFAAYAKWQAVINLAEFPRPGFAGV